MNLATKLTLITCNPQEQNVTEEKEEQDNKGLKLGSTKFISKKMENVSILI